MSVVLYIAGAIAILIGAVLVAAGIPVKEFSFGNTLILAGAVAVPGGLIVLGLAAVIAQLNRIGDMLGARPARSGRTLEPFETGSRLGQGPGQIPFPPKAKPDAHPPIPGFPTQGSREAFEAPEEPAFAPTLRNPDHEPDEAPLMPRQAGASTRAKAEPEAPVERTPVPDFRPNLEPDRSPSPTPSWRATMAPRESTQNLFDAMWPPEQRAAKPGDKLTEPREPAMREPAREMPMRETVARQTPVEPKRPELPKAASQSAGDVRAVPVLKSGVIDGMGYTLYVDGSIEAELPSGILRFASIAALRDHLEKAGG
ncbi:MAG: hypothetical protein JO205_02770 [Pseudolabrys sp.]|nr:hypothetical protein [Pseudolabrys sp.]